jgi:uncharacterized protein YkwD
VPEGLVPVRASPSAAVFADSLQNPAWKEKSKSLKYLKKKAATMVVTVNTVWQTLSESCATAEVDFQEHTDAARRIADRETAKSNALDLHRQAIHQLVVLVRFCLFG